MKKKLNLKTDIVNENCKELHTQKVGAIVWRAVESAHLGTGIVFQNWYDAPGCKKHHWKTNLVIPKELIIELAEKLKK